MYLGWSWRGRPLDVFAMEAMSLSDQRHDAHGARRGLERAPCLWRLLAVAGGDDMTVIGRGGKLHRAIEEKHGEAKTSVFFLRSHAAPQEPSIPIAARQRPL